MANAPHPANPPATAPNAPAGSAPVAPPSTHPGGMASDPVAALANEIATNIRGIPDRLRGRIDSTPALKAAYDNEYDNINASIAESIRRLVDAEVAKATGGIVPGKGEASDRAERDRTRNPSA